jgi:hypothetical protein
MRCKLIIFLFILFWLLIYCFKIPIEHYADNNKHEHYVNDDHISDKELCQNLYEKEKNKKYAIINNFVPIETCNEILNEGIEYAKRNKWTTKRHDDYPTTDNQVTNEWKSYKYLEKKVHDVVFKKIAEMYDINKNNLHIHELFIVKYEDTKQNQLDAHKDGNEFSFILALNDIDDYEGGGTCFVKQQKKIKLNKGDCLVFSGQNKHRGVKITKGKRFILAGFIYYKEDEFCEKLLK